MEVVIVEEVRLVEVVVHLVEEEDSSYSNII
jgi:hypothetical protein